MAPSTSNGYTVLGLGPVAAGGGVHDPLGGDRLAVPENLDDLLLVDGVLEGAADGDIVQGGLGDVHDVEGGAAGEFRLGDLVVAALDFGQGLGREADDDVRLARLEGGDGGRVLGDPADRDLLQVGRSRVCGVGGAPGVVGVALEDEFFGRFDLLGLEGTGADEVEAETFEAVLLEGGRGPHRDEALGDGVEEGDPGGGVDDLEGDVVDGRGRDDGSQRRGGLGGGGFRGEDAVEVGFGGGGVEGGAVVEGDAGAEGEGPGETILGRFPGGGEGGDEGAVGAGGDEGVGEPGADEGGGVEGIDLGVDQFRLFADEDDAEFAALGGVLSGGVEGLGEEGGGETGGDGAAQELAAIESSGAEFVGERLRRFVVPATPPAFDAVDRDGGGRPGRPRDPSVERATHGQATGAGRCLCIAPGCGRPHGRII